MRTKLLIASAATAALLAGAAFAQTAGAAPDTAVNPPSSSLPAGAATGNAVNGPAPSAGPNIAAPAPSPDSTVGPAPAPDSTVAPAAGPPAERTPAASVGGTDVVSSGPVPDTPANRAKYGKPMSRAGQLTKPAGN